MTYLDYSKELVNGLSRSRQFVVIIYMILKGNKGYLDRGGQLIYAAAVNQFNAGTDQCEAFLLNVINGHVFPFNEMDQTIDILLFSIH